MLQNKEIEIDESLYSRQLYVLGHDAMRRMMSKSALLINVDGLGLEVAKNLILAGIKSLTIFDKHIAQLKDMLSHYYLKEHELGQRMEEITLKYLQDLNTNVHVDILKIPHSKCIDNLPKDMNIYLNFDIIICNNIPLFKQIEINNFSHDNGIYFISCNVYGLMGSIFCDFNGKNGEFEVIDVDGEPPIVGIINSITHDKDGLVYCVDDTRHNLQDGDLIKFQNFREFKELETYGTISIRVNDPYSFYIGDTTEYPLKITGVEFIQVKKTQRLKFKSLKESLKNPNIVISDFSKLNTINNLHIINIATSDFIKEFKRLPNIQCREDSKQLLKISKEIFKNLQLNFKLDDSLIEKASYISKSMPPFMTAVIGGLAAQEVLKAISNKFNPIFQHFYFESFETLPKDLDIIENCSEIKSRYDGLIHIYGKEFMNKVFNTSVFLVGAGAIGCELMKIWSCMGLGTGPHGNISLTDMDTIEKSNLNRQFLFRNSDISKHKSKTVKQSIEDMNPDYKEKIISYEEKIGTETENLFNEDFFSKIQIVVNALDNVESRVYMDKNCVFYRLPLLDSGTLGTKCNTQVVVPYLTESYSSSQDPPEKSIPFCTLKNFPNSIEHTIQWSLDIFSGYFNNSPEITNRYLDDPDKFTTSLTKSRSNQIEVLETITKNLGDEKVKNIKDCVRWARINFEKLFVDSIKQLLFNFPSDCLTTSGTLFWSGPKRCPNYLQFDLTNNNHILFIISAANLMASINNIKDKVDNNQKLLEILDNIKITPFIPKSGVKIHINDSEMANNMPNDNIDLIDDYLSKLPNTENASSYKMNIEIFEKDDDNNYHMDFITSAANLRAMNYGIQTTTKYEAKAIAGKIIPAIATTTAYVAGLVCIELIKLIDDFGYIANQSIKDRTNHVLKKSLNYYKNSFSNLALPFFALTEPIAATKDKFNNNEWTLWHRFDLYQDITLQNLINMFKENHKLDINMLSTGRSILYGMVRQKEELNKRLNMSLSKLVEHVSNRKINTWVKSLVFEALVTDTNDEDVDIPYICLHIK